MRQLPLAFLLAAFPLSAYAVTPVSTYQPSTAFNLSLENTSPLFQDIGTIHILAGENVPGIVPNGALLSINVASDDLFTQLGTTFGGDGVNNFNLPDLTGRALLGSSPSFSISLGQQQGAPSVTIATKNLPVSVGGLGQPVPIDQPALAINYMIAADSSPPHPVPPPVLISSPSSARFSPPRRPNSRTASSPAMAAY